MKAISPSPPPRLTVACPMLRTGAVYEDLGEHSFGRRDRVKLVRRLGDLGVPVALKGAA